MPETIEINPGGAATLDIALKLRYEANPDTNSFEDAEKTKLAGQEPGATADMTGAEIKTAYEGEANTNAFTDAEKAKLGAIDAAHYGAPVQDLTALTALAEAGLTDKERRYVEDELSDYFYDATAVSGDEAPDDQTGGTGFWRKVAVGGETAASVKSKYESNADTNAFTDALMARLNAIITNNTNEGASLIGLEDNAGNLDATNVEAAIAELYALITGGIALDLVQDTTPQLGGHLDLNDFGWGFLGTNTTGAQIDKGTPVYLSGANKAIAPCDASDPATMPCIGVAAADIADAANGVIVRHGVITDLDTSAYVVFDALYPDNAGALGSTPPSPQIIQEVARVVTVHATTGIISVDAQPASTPIEALSDSETVVSADSLLLGDASASFGAIRRALVDFLLDLGVSGDLGSHSTGNLQLAFSAARYQTVTNDGGTGILPPASGEGDLHLYITNGGTAADWQTSLGTNFDSVRGDALDTTNGNNFRAFVSRRNGRTYITIEAASDNT